MPAFFDEIMFLDDHFKPFLVLELYFVRYVSVNQCKLQLPASASQSACIVWSIFFYCQYNFDYVRQRKNKKNEIELDKPKV